MEPLLYAETTEAESSPAETQPAPGIVRRLYISHFLSTWNSRLFEFGAVLFLAAIFHDSLLPVSIYALARAASAIIFSPAVGRYIDRGNRLQVVRLSIIVQRAAVAVSCVAFWFLATGWPITDGIKWTVLGVLAALACFEKLCSIMNLVSVERDWVVIIAGDDTAVLQVLNSQMRRIDLICKLGGPFAIALVDSLSTPAAVLATLGSTSISILIEYIAIKQVYNKVPGLARLPDASTSDPGAETNPPKPYLNALSLYFHHPVFLPSLSLSLLYLTVLSFAGQMITYLLSVGYTSLHIGLIRIASICFEISATWLAPFLVRRIGAFRAGLWFINWEALCLAIAGALFFSRIPRISDIALIVGVVLSRVGLWGFDLSAQVIIQTEVEAEARGSFSATEASVQNSCELLGYATTLVFLRPEQFRFPVAISCGAVFMASAVYAAFVRKRRSHLLHWPACACIGDKKAGERERELLRRRATGEVYVRLSSMEGV